VHLCVRGVQPLSLWEAHWEQPVILKLALQRTALSWLISWRLHLALLPAPE